MRVLIISGEDLAGGGHRAAFRLHQALRGIGVESFMAVRRKHSSDPHVHKMTPSELGWPPTGRGYLDLLPSFLCRRKDEPISLGLQSASLGKLVDRFKPDIVNLHWINGGIASIRAVGKLQVPVVWTLHDMWPFTGGCHYSGGCTQYLLNCRKCPKIKSIFGAPAVTRWVHERKRKHWGTNPLHAITPSAWMKELALASSLFAEAKITHIPNCVDAAVFNSGGREKTRSELALPRDSKAVLFSSANQSRKGANIIPKFIQLLRRGESTTSWRFLFMGGLPPLLEPQIDTIALPHSTNETRVATYYAASDLYVLPSLEDNLPNTVSESLNCGTPVIAFPTGGIPEMIENFRNGVLSKDLTAESLVAAVQTCLRDRFLERHEIANNARATYAPNVIASQHQQLYRELLSAFPSTKA
jgi:glycosyltransferase involved in cell wall biosynthesis